MNSRFKKLIYTLQHKVAFLRVERQLTGHISIRGLLHDMDKVFMIIFCPWMDIKQIHQIHRKHSHHHVDNNLPKTNKDRLESIIDWECARYTKPDKPLNAYDTLMKFYPEQKGSYLPLILQYLPEEVTDK